MFQYHSIIQQPSPSSGNMHSLILDHSGTGPYTIGFPPAPATWLILDHSGSSPDSLSKGSNSSLQIYPALLGKQGDVLRNHIISSSAPPSMAPIPFLGDGGFTSANGAGGLPSTTSNDFGVMTGIVSCLE
jgi:hypothetical protein